MKEKTINAEKVNVPAPRFRTVLIRIVGVTPYVQHRFWKKDEIQKSMEIGSQTKKGRKREARNYDREFREAQYKLPGGKGGIPANAFRSAIISACRTVGFKMSHAKLGVFIEHDGFDPRDGTPLVRIEGRPTRHDAAARLKSGAPNIVVRPMWKAWKASLRIRFDEDMFSATDIAHLMMRVGLQVGIGEGRPDSKESAGMGWGLFEIQK